MTYSVISSYSTYTGIYNNGNDYAVYLSNPTFYTYAQLKVTGKFLNDEKIYTEDITVIIVPGEDATLEEKAIAHIQSEADDIDVLYNILETRKEDGIINEDGSFTLPGTYSIYDIKYSVNNTSKITSIEGNNEIYNGKLSASSDGKTTIQLFDEYTINVNPEYFESSESYVLISATLYYNGNGSKTDRKQCGTYSISIRLPAVLTVSDFSNVSVFNSTQYQVYSNVEDSLSTFDISGTTVTNNSKGYILIRDIVGDEYYIDNYLNQKEGLYYNKYSSSTYGGVSSLEYYLPLGKDSGTSNEVAWDFTKLLEWALGTNKTVTASSLVSKTSYLESYGSTTADGKSYLTDKEINVLKTYYMNATNCTEDTWTALFNSVSNKAPGYLINDTASLNTTISSIINKMSSSNSDKATNYFKYVETLQWATDEKDFPSGGGRNTKSTPNLGIIGTKDWYKTKDSTGDSVTLSETKDGSTNSNSYTYSFTDSQGYRWYYRSTTYNASSNYSKYNTNSYVYNGTTYYYLDDDTSYITECEAEVIMALWLNQNITYGEEFVNAWYNCAVIPTYLNSNGTSTLISSLYNVLDYTVGSRLSNSNNANTQESFVATMVNNVPSVTCLDYSLNAISHFTSLTSLTIKGNYGLDYSIGSNSDYYQEGTNHSAFLDTTALSALFNRLANNNQTLTSLTMQSVANGNTTFDVSNTKKLIKLTYIDFSHNHGITSTNVLVNTNRKKYATLDIHDIGTGYEFVEYTIKGVYNSSLGSVIYTDVNNLTQKYATTDILSDALSYLDEFSEINNDTLALCEAVYDSNGDEVLVYYRVSDGNEIYATAISEAGMDDSIATVDAAMRLISPYYYCKSSFTYSSGTNSISFEEGYIYQVTYLNNKIVATKVCEATLEDYSNTLTEEELEANKTSSGGSKVVITTKEVVKNGEEIYSQSLRGTANTYSLIYNYYTFSQSVYMYYYGGSGTASMDSLYTYYLSLDKGSLFYTDTLDSSCYFVFLTENQSNFLKWLIDCNYEVSSDLLNNKMTEYGISITNNNIILGESLSTTVGRYMYNPATSKYVTSSGGANKKASTLFYGSETNIYYDTDHYLNMVRSVSLSQGRIFGYASIQFGSLSSDDLTDSSSAKTTGTKTNSNWTFGNNTLVYCNINYSSAIPVITFTETIEAKTYTATFNCYQFASRISTNQYASDTGSYLYYASSTSKSTYFCLLSAEDVTRLTNWLDNAASNETFGVSYTKASSIKYYLYCPYTNRFVCECNEKERTSTTSSLDNAGLYNITNITGSYYTLHTVNGTTAGWNYYGGVGNSSYIGGWACASSNTGSHWSISSVNDEKQFVIDASTISNNITAYSLGYDYIGSQTITTTVSEAYSSEIEKYYFLTKKTKIGDVIYPAGRVIKVVYGASFGNQSISKVTIYELKLWYKASSTSDKVYMDVISGDSFSFKYYIGSSIDSANAVEGTVNVSANSFTYYSDLVASTTVNNLANDEENESGSGGWVVNDPIVSNYISYVKNATNSTISFQEHVYENNANSSYLYLSSFEGYVNYYDQSDTTTTSITYLENEGYYLSVDSNGLLSFNDSGESESGTTMQSILATANKYFNTQEYGNYYGKYYAYSGSTTTMGDLSLTQNTIYRILPNDDNSAFTWVAYKTYTSSDIDTVMINILNGSVNEGDVYYITSTDPTNAAASRTYAVGFYEITYNDNTGAYYLKKFNDVIMHLETESTNANGYSSQTTISYIENARIYKSGSFYGGTGGSIEVVIEAVVKVYDATTGTYIDNVRRYKVIVVG